MAKSKRNLRKGWEGDFDISTAQFREIFEIPGYRLRKPLEVALFELSDRGNPAARYKIIHHLPTTRKKITRGKRIEGWGATEDEAARDFSSNLAGYYRQLCHRSLARARRGAEELQREYLDTILIKD